MEAEPWIGPASDMSMETGPLVLSEKVLDPSSWIHEDRRTPPEVLCLGLDGSAVSPIQGWATMDWTDTQSRLGLCQRQLEHFVKFFCAEPSPIECPWSPLGDLPR